LGDLPCDNLCQFLTLRARVRSTRVDIALGRGKNTTDWLASLSRQKVRNMAQRLQFIFDATDQRAASAIK
jgi:hypothetical protein